MPADLASMIFATTAHVVARATSDELLTLAEQRGADRSVFETHAPFFWANEISSNRLDAYFTRMDPLTTLPNFAADAARGVAFLAGHNNRVLPFGSTLTGTVETAGDITRVLADAYTLAGLDLGGVNTNSFIAGVRAGIIKDDSVGFYGGQWICDICGRDMLTDWWDCWHVPGLVYEIKDTESGNQTVVRELLCSATVKNANLAEVSAVYDGATPGAAILQAQRAAESGQLSPLQARLIEQRYRINLPDKRIIVPGSDIPSKERTVDPEQITTEVTPAPVVEVIEEAPAETPVEEVADVPAVETPAAETPSEQRSVATAAPADAFAGIRAALGLDDNADIAAAVRGLQAQAEDGRAYRTAQVDAAIAEGVRALGSDFDEDSYRAMLQVAPIATVQRMKQDWERIANSRFVGGRKTVDQAPEAPRTAPVVPAVPDAAFAG